MTMTDQNTHPSKGKALADNKRWLKLMSEQSEQNRKSRDPRLYRQSSQTDLIRPQLPDTDS